MRRQRMSILLVVSGALLLAFGLFTPARTSQAAQGDIPTRPPAPSATPIPRPPTDEPTAEPATAVPPTAEPATAEPATAEPPTATPEPPTAEPATAEPATAEPATAEPATAVPPTAAPPPPTSGPAVGGVRDNKSPLPVTAIGGSYNYTWVALGGALMLAGIALWMLRRRRARPAMEDYDFWLDNK